MDETLLERDEELRQAQKMEAIGRFAGGIAHDFNNMLTAISGYNAMIMKRLEKDGADVSDSVEIDEAAKRAAALVQQILAFSRRQVLSSEVVDLNETINKTKGMLERIIGEDVSLAINLDPALCAVRADPGQIEQVLLNLAANARDAMPRGGELSIRTSNATLHRASDEGAGALPPGTYACVVVEDTGMGMSEETRAQIFDPFFTTKDVSEGTGLGLSTVYGIVHQSGGDVSVASEPDHWTRFVIHLPQCEDEAEKEVALAPPPRPTPEYDGSQTILLVEDEPGVRKLTRRMLESLGYSVIEARNGNEALELASKREESLPLLVTDVVMPEIGGGELVERLLVDHPEMRVLYVSGYADHRLGAERLREERAAFLPKPFTQQELAEKLGELVAGERGS